VCICGERAGIFLGEAATGFKVAYTVSRCDQFIAYRNFFFFFLVSFVFRWSRGLSIREICEWRINRELYGELEGVRFTFKFAPKKTSSLRTYMYINRKKIDYIISFDANIIYEPNCETSWWRSPVSVLFFLARSLSFFFFFFSPPKFILFGPDIFYLFPQQSFFQRKVYNIFAWLTAMLQYT